MSALLMGTTRLRRFLSLSPADRRLVVQAAVVLLVATVGVRLLSLERLRAIVARVSRPSGTKTRRDAAFPARTGWAVATASAFVPGATCLTQALVVQLLLERRGYEARLRIGIARGAEQALRGHAWVEHDGVAILGQGFQPELVLPAREEARRDER